MKTLGEETAQEIIRIMTDVKPEYVDEVGPETVWMPPDAWVGVREVDYGGDYVLRGLSFYDGPLHGRRWSGWFSGWCDG